jgi:hypothetical protein
VPAKAFYFILPILWSIDRLKTSSGVTAIPKGMMPFTHQTTHANAGLKNTIGTARVVDELSKSADQALFHSFSFMIHSHSIAVMPMAPQNGSPVPWLTSLYHKSYAGPYGDRRYPGNCSGELIKDLLLYFKPKRVLDPMTGSGTCADVCRELGIECVSFDIREGKDACVPSTYKDIGKFDFVWVHPPYWRMKLYTDDIRDMSNTLTLQEFLLQYAALIYQLKRAMTDGGKLAILMGDYEDREDGYCPLVYHTQRLCFEAGLKQNHTQIIRFSHGASSSKKIYKSSFIPGLHDVCTIVQKPVV